MVRAIPSSDGHTSCVGASKRFCYPVPTTSLLVSISFIVLGTDESDLPLQPIANDITPDDNVSWFSRYVIFAIHALTQ